MTIGEASPEGLREHLLEIVGERHLRTSPEHHDAVGRLVAEGLREFGWEVEEHPVRGPFGIGANVVGRKRGVHDPERCWIVGAHYDTVAGTPGADDNGIAVAGLLELARPGAPIVFSISKIAVEEGGFGDKMAELARAGAWSLEDRSKPFRTYPFSEQYAGLRHWINVYRKAR